MRFIKHTGRPRGQLTHAILQDAASFNRFRASGHTTLNATTPLFSSGTLNRTLSPPSNCLYMSLLISRGTFVKKCDLDWDNRVEDGVHIHAVRPDNLLVGRRASHAFVAFFRCFCRAFSLLSLRSGPKHIMGKSRRFGRQLL